jgi:methyl-accepting chemotaxis protein
MKNNEFRTPLIQSGALLVAIVFIISLIPSGDGMSVGSIIGAFFAGIFKMFLFVLALSIALVVSIAVLIGIFIAAVALQSPEKASEIYAETKCRLAALLQGSLGNRSISTESTNVGISQEEYDSMKTQLNSLQNTNLNLRNDVSSLSAKNMQLQEDIHALTKMVDELKESEKKTLELIESLSAKMEEEPDTELKDQITKLEQMNKTINDSIADIANRLESLEEAATEPEPEPLSGGIFSYIESEEDQAVFTQTVKNGVAKELTYAQFDKFLTEELSAELDQILKDHPSLTKDYIRDMRK